jgi:hypothetical protein
MGYFDVAVGYLHGETQPYHPSRGLALNRVHRDIMLGRNELPQVFYGFLRQDEGFPFAMLFDKCGKEADEFPFLENPEEIPVLESQIRLPGHFAEALHLKGSVYAVGVFDMIELWNPEDWIMYRDIMELRHGEEWAALMEEIFEHPMG